MQPSTASRRRPVALGAICAMSAIFAVPSRAHADSLEDTLGTRAVSQGEAVRASASGASATQVNPAGVALTHSYSLEATYGYRGEDSATVANAAVCDSVTNRVGACVYYSYFGSSPEGGDRSLHDIGLTLALPLGDKVMVGTTGRYIDYTESGTQALPEDESRDGSLVFDFGLIVKPTPELALAGVGYNLIGHDEDNFPRAIGSGFAFNVGDRFSIGADGVWKLDHPDDEKTGRYGVGAELFLTGDGGEQGYPIRAGYIYDRARNAQYLTGGLGFVTARVALEAGLRKQVAGDEGDELMFLVGLKLFVPQ
jgi:hypothetical protein